MNVVGYSPGNSKKIADVYMWMGDGGSRDYSSFENNDAYVYNIETGAKQLVDSLSFWKNSAPETSSNHKMIRRDVWSADSSSVTTPGRYRVAIDGIIIVTTTDGGFMAKATVVVESPTRISSESEH